MRFSSPPNKWALRASRSLRESCVKREVPQDGAVYSCIYCGKLLTQETAVPSIHGWTCATCVAEADDEARQR